MHYFDQASCQYQGKKCIILVYSTTERGDDTPSPSNPVQLITLIRFFEQAPDRDGTKKTTMMESKEDVKKKGRQKRGKNKEKAQKKKQVRV